MLTVYLCGVMLLLVACTGGSLSRLAHIRFRHTWLLWAALIDQVVVISILPDSQPRILAAAHVGSYVMAAIWLLANRRHPGTAFIGLGGGLNGLVIALNGGTLPASADAVRAAGRVVEEGHFSNSGVLADPRLPMFGDIFATPAWLPGNNVFSIGDVAIWVGLVLFLWRTCRSSPEAPRHRHPESGYDGRHVAPRRLVVQF